MLRDPEGWHAPPPGATPPRDYAEDDEPPYRGRHPLRVGTAAAWVIFGLFLISPLLIVAGVCFAWWGVFEWLIRKP